MWFLCSEYCLLVRCLDELLSGPVIPVLYVYMNANSPHFLIIYKYLKSSRSVLHIKVKKVKCVTMLRRFCILLLRAVLGLSSLANKLYIDSLKLGTQLITHPFLLDSVSWVILQNVVIYKFLRQSRTVCFSSVVIFIECSCIWHCTRQWGEIPDE